MDLNMIRETAHLSGASPGSINKYSDQLRHGLKSTSLALLIVATGVSQVYAGDRQTQEANIIADVVSAPVVSNGLVANKPTEFNIILAPKKAAPGMELDPTVRGFQIPAGGRLELELGGSFMRNKDPDGVAVVNPVAPNANIILTTGPQNPIVATAGDGVQHGNWSVSDDGNNLLTISPNGGHGKNGLENERAKKIGIKVIHLRPNPGTGSGPAVFWNGDAGTVGSLMVRIFDAHGNMIAKGFKDIVFRADIGRQAHITNAGLTTGAQGSPATLDAELVELSQFQTVAPGSMLTNGAKAVPFSSGLPYAPRFLLFENANAQPDDFIPQTGIDGVEYMVNDDNPWTAKLMEQGNVIGAIVLSGPSSNDRGMILPGMGPTIIGGNGSVLSVPVKVGSTPGNYKVTVTLLDGNSATTVIKVRKSGEDEDD